MSFKLLLAEALEVLKQATRDEQACDHLQIKMSQSSKQRAELPNLRRKYAAVFDLRIQGLEMLNHVRVTSGDKQLAKFCADTMVGGMDACERVRDKETSILLPAMMVQSNFNHDSVTMVGDNGRRQVVDSATPTGRRTDGLLITKDGYSRSGDPIFELGEDMRPTLSGSEPFRKEWTLSDGAYQLSVVNNDDFAIASPEIDVMLQSESPSTGQRMLYRKKLPAGCAWCRFIGVVSTSVVRIAVASDAWMRKSKVRIELVRITNPSFESKMSFTSGSGPANPQAAEAEAMAIAARHEAAGPLNNSCHPSAYGDDVPSWFSNSNASGYENAVRVEPLGMPSMATMLMPTKVIGPAPPSMPLGTASSAACASPQYVDGGHQGTIIEISPANLTPQQRLLKIRGVTWQWYDEPPQGYSSQQYNSTEVPTNKDLLAAIEALAEPTPLSDD